MTEASDWRALSLLETERPTLMEVLGGVGFALAVFAAIPALALLSAYVFGGMQSIVGSSVDDLPPVPIEVIETRFVRLGKRKEPRSATRAAAGTPRLRYRYTHRSHRGGSCKLPIHQRIPAVAWSQ